MINDFTGGPVQFYLAVVSNGVLAVRMSVYEVKSYGLRRRVRSRLLSQCPDCRVSIDGEIHH